MQAIVVPQSRGAAAGTPFHKVSTDGTNATTVKTSPGTVYTALLTNRQSAPRFVKLYDKADAPVVGTDTPVLTLQLPGNVSGSGMVAPIPVGVRFDTGIAFAITTGAPDDDVTGIGANDVIVDLVYA